MPDSPPDYYNRLLEQRRAEYATKGLSKIPPDFLASTSRYLATLRDLLEREARENPTSRKVEMTRSTYQRALASARDVLEARLGKIAHLAAQHVNLGGEPANLLAEERALYDALLRDLSGFRRSSAPFLESPSGSGSGGPASSSPIPSPPPATTATTTVRATSASEHGPVPVSASPAPTSPGEATPRAPSSSASTTPSTVSAPSPPTVIRLLQDRPALAMPSETVDLRKEDLLTLPQEKAQVLVHAKIAERVEVRPPTRVT